MVNIWGERLGALGAILFGLFMLQIGYSFPVGGHIFPVFATVSMILIGAVMILRTLIFSKNYTRELQLKIEPASSRPILFTFLSLGYFLLTFRLGYFASTFLFLLIMPYILGLRKHWAIILSAVLANLFIYGVFQWSLNARLPSGILI